MTTLSEFITFLTATCYVNNTKGKQCCVSMATIGTRNSTSEDSVPILLLLSFDRTDAEMALDNLTSLPAFLQSRQANSGTVAPTYK